MAIAGEEEEVEYESDPEEARLPLTMRRREASDDEEGDGEEREKPSRCDARVGIDSDSESDGQGGVAVYGDDESEMEEEEEVEEEEEEEDFEERDITGGDNGAVEVEDQLVVTEFGGEGPRSSGQPMECHGENQVEKGKKGNEPFAVPTAGAFYMHDDRFKANNGGRHRHTPGGRKLWESKDDRKWGHDKFEEMNLQETHYEKERRNFRGYYRGRGKNRGVDHGNVRGNRSRAHDNRNNQNYSSKSVRGRGPRRYEPPARNKSETPPPQNKQSRKSLETSLVTSSRRISTHTQTSNVQSDPAPPRKHVFASSLNVSSPPFYPSGSSNQDIPVTQKRDLQVGSTNKSLQHPILIEEKISASHSSSLLQPKTDSIGQERLYVGDSIRPVVGKLKNLQLQSAGSSPINKSQSPQSKPKGRGLAISGQISHLPIQSNNQVSRISQQTQLPAVNRRPVQSQVQPSLGSSTQHLHQRPGSGSQASPPKASSTNSSEPGESIPGSSKSRAALVVKGKESVQGSSRGSFLYSGAHVIGGAGSLGVAHGDQSFPGTPALLPVMQFGGQHPGGIGVPAVGMALPGYVAQSQLGLGTSDMAWVQVLAGAAGALGATYCSPYLAVDSGYYARPSGQTSSLDISSKETSTNKPNNAWKPPQRPELVNDEFGQRQNKPCRYSEMNFGQ